MKLSISEILKKASQSATDQDRANTLRAHDTVPLRQVLWVALDPRVKWLLPEGNPPYKPCDLVDQQHRLFTEARKFYLFLEGGNPNLKQLRREALFIELLESLDPEDAKLVLAAKDKKIPYPGITTEVVNLAFPGLIDV
jgi:hypothetical protein